MTKESECKSCGEPIVWTETKTGRKMPVDAEPDPGGNVELHEYRGGLMSIVHGRSTIAEARERAELHRSHFDTCPDRKGWRR